MATSIDAALALIGDAPAHVIGGAQIYAEILPKTDRLIVTEISKTFNCDAFFPAIDSQQWKEISREPHHSDAQDLDYAFVIYERR